MIPTANPTPEEIAHFEEWAARVWADVAASEPQPDEPEPETCWRCRGSREIPNGRGIGPGGRDYDPCPECDPEA